ncbi:MAG: cytochrome-c peroxidase [Crocinitomicaceae bacterium]|nr:cytochrome-c peroxidase [Crocinitomicaceae bacterium]
MRSYWGFLIALCISCNSHTDVLDGEVNIKIPSWFPEIAYPEDNVPTKARIELGRRLFFSEDISAGGKISCASCHTASAAFTDGRKVSIGAHGKPGKRNAPTLENLAWMPYFMMEGGVPTLELQAIAPITDTLEMAKNLMVIAEELNNDDYFKSLSLAAYGRPVDPYVITRALACYQRTFISGDSRYDRVIFEKRNDQMNEEERAGMDLFFSPRTHCSECHSGVFFTDYNFYNIGLYETYTDIGKERENYNVDDRGKFKTPTLRNIELTPPYMHDGSISSLEEVIDFFNEGGKNNPVKDPRIHPLGLNEKEKEQLLAFLKCLTDWNFVQNAAFLPLE